MDLEQTTEENAVGSLKVKELCEATVSFISDYAEREDCSSTIVVAATMAAAASVVESVVDFLLQNGHPDSASEFVDGIRRGWSITTDRIAGQIELSTQEGK